MPTISIYEIPSRELVDRIPLIFLRRAYWSLHDLELDLAVQKVGPPVGQENRAADRATERAAE